MLPKEINYLAEARKIHTRLIEIRRDIHMHPELGMEEHRTAGIVENILKSLGIETKRLAGTGVAGLLEGGKPGKTVALRADMDALPIVDEKKVEYASKIPGKMHACGHDAHTTCLLGAAMLLAKYRDFWPGNVKFIFQPAEETVGGALPMIEEGVLEGPAVDAIFGLHCEESIPAGKIGLTYDKMHAASDQFEVLIHGKSCHGAAPHKGVDAIAVGAQIVCALQNIVSRNIDPLDSAVVTVGAFQGGCSSNVIADKVRLAGIIRTLTPETREFVRQRVEKTVRGIADAMGAEVEIKLIRSYPALINNDEMVDLVRKAAEDALGRENIVLVNKPSMGVEDFAYFLQKVPGAYFHLGVRNEEKGIVHPGHSSLFDIDEDALPIGAAMLGQVATRYLGE